MVKRRKKEQEERSQPFLLLSPFTLWLCLDLTMALPSHGQGMGEVKRNRNFY
jgi:hypothetical protein